MKIVLSPNPFRDKGLKAALAAQDILREAGVDTAICLPFSVDAVHPPELPEGLELQEISGALLGADMLVCFGGDGTILHAAKYADACGVPILGVNMGSVGFMAELEHSELQFLKRLTTGMYSIERRMMLDVKVQRGSKTLFRELALNDAVITKGAVARVIDLAVLGDGVLISNYTGDGVIVSTPTGSTAYSMSAGGPIVEPTAENIIVTPICAHTLQAKSMVLGRDRMMSIHICHQSRKTAYLSVDGGKAFKLFSGDTVEVTRSKHQTRLIRLSDRSFYEIVNQKLGKA
jgi:NAD+ kinase